MKNDGVSANIADNDHGAMSGAPQQSVTELASAFDPILISPRSLCSMPSSVTFTSLAIPQS